jgi:hypothetical protein
MTDNVYDDTGMLVHDEEEAQRIIEERLVTRSIAWLLDYSFKDASYHWKNLTAKERSILQGSPAVFESVLKWMREHKHD